MRAAATDESIADAAARRRARARHLAGLYALTPDVDDTAVLVARAAAALAGGAAALQYRHKTAAPALRRTQAAALARLSAARGGLFIVNDDPALAAAVDADGVHVGADEAPVAAARAAVGPARLIGVSCGDDFERAQAAVAAGADYVAFGSFFASATNPAARRADVALLARARVLGVPVVASGGIVAGNARLLVDAGADALAVVRDVFAAGGAAEITRAAAALVACFGPARAANTGGDR
jgi:thiamine-phosphate pyrophosphorylase